MVQHAIRFTFYTPISDHVHFCAFENKYEKQKKFFLARLKSGKRQNTKWLTKHFSERRRHDICFKPEAFLLKIVKFNFNICGTWVFLARIDPQNASLGGVLVGPRFCALFFNTSLNSPIIVYANYFGKDYLSPQHLNDENATQKISE